MEINLGNVIKRNESIHRRTLKYESTKVLTFIVDLLISSDPPYIMPIKMLNYPFYNRRGKVICRIHRPQC